MFLLFNFSYIFPGGGGQLTPFAPMWDAHGRNSAVGRVGKVQGAPDYKKNLYSPRETVATQNAAIQIL